MIHLTRTTAAQYAPQHIRVNTVLPGLMKTPMVEKSAGLAAQYGQGDVEEMWKARDAQCPMGHMGDAWDVAYACLYLASDEANTSPASSWSSTADLRLNAPKYPVCPRLRAPQRARQSGAPLWPVPLTPRLRDRAAAHSLRVHPAIGAPI